MTDPVFREPTAGPRRRPPTVPASDPALIVACTGLVGCGSVAGEDCRQLEWERQPGDHRERVHMIRVALYRRHLAELEVRELEREELRRASEA